MGIKILSKVLAKQTQQHIEMVIYHNCQRLTLQGEEGNHTQVNKHKTLSKHHETEQDSESWCETLVSESGPRRSAETDNGVPIVTEQL